MNKLMRAKAKVEKYNMPYWDNFNPISTATVPTTPPPDGYVEVQIWHCPNCGVILGQYDVGSYLNCWQCRLMNIEAP